MTKAEKTYQIRKLENNDVITIPQGVMNVLGVVTGDEIQYVFLSDGSVRIEKAKKEVATNSVLEQYEEDIKDLFE